MADKEPKITAANITPDFVARMVVLVFGTMADKKPFWCFVAVKPSEYDHVQQLVAQKKLDLRTYVNDGYGEIVVSGEGVIPPNDVLKTVSAMFNIPIRQFFQDVDADSIIAKEVERVKKELGEA